MTLLRLKTLAIALCISGLSYAQTTNAFRVNYDQAFLDLPGNAIEALTLNNYVFAGTNANFIPIYGTVTQVNDIGALVWSKRYYDGSFGFQINDIKKDPALNEYYVCGGSESNAGVFMRLDAAGNVIVSKRFSITQADGAYLNRVIKTSDGGYVAVGYVTGHDPDGAGPEIKFSPINYIDADGDPQNEVIGSPLIVKFNANGDHVWHHVFRYYTAVTKTPAQRIYNDASLSDVVEVADGYIAVGQYDVNQHLSRTNSDGDDSTPNDAIILKTSTAGAITYHKQIDNPSTNSTQSSKYLAAINKTSVGDPIAAGATDDGYELIMKYGAVGAFSLTFSRRFRYSGSLFGTDPADISQIYEVDGGTDLVTMAMYVRPLAFSFSNSLHRVNATATANTWAKSYTFGLATILPRGSKTSDGGYIMTSTVLAGGGFDYHLIKTDPAGETPIAGCTAVSFTPTASAGPNTIADPFANNWSGTPGPQALAVTVANVTPTSTVQCSFVACTPPTAPVVGTITQPTCSVSTGSVALSGLPASGTWTVTASPGGATITGTGAVANFTGLAANSSYTFTVTLAGCTSVASNSAAINAAPTVPTAPVVGTITQPTCSVSTGSVALSGLPGSGSWTVTASPGGATTTGSGTTTAFSGLTANTTYTFTVTNASGCTSTASTNAALNPVPTTPAAPLVGTITQPTCNVNTGSVDFTGLPSSGTWTLTALPGGATSTGTGTTGTFAGLTAGASYTFTVTNAGGCTSTASTSAAINAAPIVPTPPITGTITQPTCLLPNGTVELSGLPSSGTWTVTANPGAITQTGTGTIMTFGSLPAGNSYTFTVTNSAGCASSASASAVINSVPGAPTSPVIGTITQPTCIVSTGSVDLSGLPATGTWTLTSTPGGTTTGTGTTTSISGLAAGTSYTFMVTNDLGCTSSSSSSAVIIAQPITPTAPIVGSITQPTCTVATGDISISGLPSTGTWTITATPGGLTQTGTGTTSTFTGLSANTYTFTVTNSDGCTSTVSSTSATINTQPATPSAPIAGTVTQPTCLSPTASVDVSGLPAPGTWTLTSAPGGISQTGTGTTATFNGLAAGTTYTLTVTNSVGCTSVSSASVVVNSVPGAPTAPTAGTITQPTCALPTGTIEVASPLGANFTYSIDGTTFQAGTTFSGLNPGNYTITVLDNTSGCSSVSAASVNIDPVVGTPTLSLVTSTSVTCAGDTDGALEISVAGGIAPYTYAWLPNIGSGNILTNLAAGSYDVTVTDDAGCSSTATFAVGSPTAIAVNGIETNVICGSSDGSITTAVSGGTAPYTYSWTPNNEITSSLTGLAAGNYSVLVTDDNGCAATESFTISTTGSLPVDINPSYASIDAGETVQLTVTGGQNYTWTPATGLSCTDCANPIASPTTTTTYYVTATDPNGCTGGDTILIEIKLACGEIFVPTAFSPNDKGPSANNTLCVYGTPACIKELLFQVYDRWGEVVFETTDITKCWDGMFKDKMMNSGIYVYRLYAELTNGDIVDTSGNTTLVR
jgi:gliding motility-associated-like protein